KKPLVAKAEARCSTSLSTDVILKLLDDEILLGDHCCPVKLGGAALKPRSSAVFRAKMGGVDFNSMERWSQLFPQKSVAKRLQRCLGYRPPFTHLGRPFRI